MSERVNPRWLVWERAEGAGLPTWRFIVWIQARWSEWRKLTGYRGGLGPEHHAAFDAWLNELSC